MDEVSYPPPAPTSPAAARQLVQGFLLASVASQPGAVIDQQGDDDGQLLPWFDLTVHGTAARVRVTGVPRDVEPTPLEELRERLAHDLDEDGGVQSAVFTALGAASVCWEDLGGAGVFDSTRAKVIGEVLVQWLLDWRAS